MRDVTVIGAGPAGSFAAMLLARSGWRVDLIEQHRFPRDKVCGECLSALGFDVLHRAGLGNAFASLAPVRLSYTLLHAADGRSTRAELPDAMWGVSRNRFDAMLLGTARDAGANVHQPMRCESIAPGAGVTPASTSILCRDLTTNTPVEFHPVITILADGKAALLPTRPTPTQDLGVKAHFKNLAAPRDAIQLFGVDGHYGGVAPIEDDRFNIAFSIPTSRVRDFNGDFDALFARLLQENPTLAHQFRGAHRVSDWLASPLPRFAVSNHWPPNVIPIGNAAAALEPIGGEGMGLALRSAELAVDAIVNGTPLPTLRRQFNRLWRSRRLITRAAAIVVSSPRLAGPSLELTNSAPHLGTIAMRMMGKRTARAIRS